VDRETGFIIAAKPLQHLRAAIGFGNFDGKVQATKSDSFAEQIPNDFGVVILKERMPWATIGIKHNRGCIVETVGVARPAVGVDHGSEAGDAIKAFFQQQTTRAVFVLTVSMAWRAG